MKPHLGRISLIICFGFSNLNLSWAVETVDVPPVIVQPYQVQQLDQQMMDRDRRNRDEEIAIKQLIEQNNKLTQETLAKQEDDGLAQVNKTMLSYRDALYARDRGRIIANSERWMGSRYGDLIRLTQDADAMTVHRDLVDKDELLAQKYQMLTQLKDEMTALNDKLLNQEAEASDQKDKTLDGFKKISQQEQDKIQMLIQRLTAMDKRISRLDATIAEKDHQISELRRDLNYERKQVSMRDEKIQDQQEQIAILQSKESPGASMPAAAPSSGADLKAKDAIIKEKQAQVDLLKSELESKIGQDNNAPGPNVKPSNARMQEQQNEIKVLKAQVQALTAKQEDVKLQAQEMSRSAQDLRDKAYGQVRDRLTALEDRIKRQDADLKAKNDTIRWLHQVVDLTKQKAEYNRLTDKINQMPSKEYRQEIESIKNDFSRRLKDYNHLQDTILGLNDKVSRMGVQLATKQDQVDLLKSELEAKITQLKAADKQNARLEQGWKAKFQDKEKQIAAMKASIQSLQQQAAAKEKIQDNVGLAKQLISLQQQEASLLEEKGNLQETENTIFDRRFTVFESRMNELLAARQIQVENWKARIQELQGLLDQKEQEVENLRGQLEDKIAQEKNQAVLTSQIQDLQAQIQDKENYISTLRSKLQNARDTEVQLDSMKQQLASEQDKEEQLRQQVEMNGTSADSYRKKLEEQGNVTGSQLAQIQELTAQLQQKEMQIEKIKQASESREQEAQAKDLSLSIMQQKTADEKINEYKLQMESLHAAASRQAQQINSIKADLELARQQLAGMPSSDELTYLQTGLDKATEELKQKDAELSKIKANADEYAKAFKKQSADFESLKTQLADAQDEIARKNEDIKYKDMALVRMKRMSRSGDRDLKAQVEDLSRKLDEAQKKLAVKTYGSKGAKLQKELSLNHEQIKDLKAELNDVESPYKNNPLEKKLKQALEKIESQGRIINVLAQKLEDAGQKVDLTRIEK